MANKKNKKSQKQPTTTTSNANNNNNEEEQIHAVDSSTPAVVSSFSNTEDIDEVEFFESIRQIEELEKKKSKPKANSNAWKNVELNDVEVMNCEGMSGFEELDMNAIDDYDALVQSLLGKKKATDYDDDVQGNNASATSAASMDDTEDEQSSSSAPKINKNETTAAAANSEKKKKNKKRKREEKETEETTEENETNTTETVDEQTATTTTTETAVDKEETNTTTTATTTGETEEKKKKKKKKKKAKKVEEASSNAVEGEAVVVEQVEVEQKEQLKPIVEWLEMGIEPGVLQCLQRMNFIAPTPIQKQSIPLAIKNGKDIVAAAETGSGKTLAFGIPIISQLLKKRVKLAVPTGNNTMEVDENEAEEDTNKKQSVKKQTNLEALILVPTRELAKQVSTHIRSIIPPKGEKYEEDLKIMNVFGGMSEAKQNRQLAARPHIVVATPGRFWDFCQRGFDYLTELHHLKYLVIDEADRMFAQGHFPELLNILDYVEKRRAISAARLKLDLPRVQKFISSATLTLESDDNKHVKSSTDRSDKSVSALNQLIDMMKMAEYEIVNVYKQTENGDSLLAKSLTEAQIQCGDEEDKMAQLYYFLLTYPGRTLVFTNTIKKARLIHQLFHGVLGLEKVNILHGEMQQRARLKNLDRFSGEIGRGGDAVLVATDVAARGLDIPDVKHVIHFDIPTKPDVYIHRCGRSGRALKQGFSLALVAPEDKKAYEAVCNKAHNGQDIDPFPLSGHYFATVPLLRRRIKVGTKIEGKQRKVKRSRTDQDWFKRNAEEMDIELDGHFFPGMADSGDELEHNEDKELTVLKRELAKLMKTKIQERKDRDILSKSFITSTPENFETVSQVHDKPEDALTELMIAKSKKLKKQAPSATKQAENEETTEDKDDQQQKKKKNYKKNRNNKRRKVE